MPSIYKNNKVHSELRLIYKEDRFNRHFYGKDEKDKFLTIAWNQGEDQTVIVDGTEYSFPKNAVLSLMINQSFDFYNSKSIVAWQFNREFYCIVDHDKEVSCVGFLFYGSSQLMFVKLDTKQQRKLALLFRVFEEEFETADNIQEDMLRMLIKRLIIIVTRLAKIQYLPAENFDDDKLDIMRRYNLLVENNFHTQHGVKFYAARLYRSPKTLSNLFAIYNRKSPIAVIHDRIILEAKRLLLYTDKTIKEIAFELGYEDAAYFSNFFKKQTSRSPSDFKNAKASSFLKK